MYIRVSEMSNEVVNSTLDALFASISPSEAVRELIEERYNICMLFYCLCLQDAEAEVPKYGAFDKVWIESQFKGWLSVEPYTLLKTFTGADIDFHPLVYQGKTYIGKEHGQRICIDIMDANKNLIENLELGLFSEYICCLILESGKLFASDEEGEVKAWDCNDDSMITVLNGSEGDLLCYNNDENRLYSASYSIEVWDLITHELLHTIITDQESDVECLVVDNGKIYCGCTENIHIYSSDDYTQLAKLDVVADDRGIIVIHEDKLYATTSDYGIKVFDILNGYNLITTLEGHTKWILSLIIDDNKIYSGGEDNSIKIWNGSTHSLITTLTEPMSNAEALNNLIPRNALTIHDNKLYAKHRTRFGDEKNSIKVWTL